MNGQLRVIVFITEEQLEWDEWSSRLVLDGWLTGSWKILGTYGTNEKKRGN
jgi:hypothetical protein